MNDDFNLDAALADELTPKAPASGNESGKADPTSQAAGGETPAGQGDKGAEQATFKLPDGRMVTQSEAQRLWNEEFMPDYTKKSQELAELRKGNPNKQSASGEETDGKDDSPVDQALASEVDRTNKHLKYVKRDEVAQMIEQMIPRTAGAIRAEGLLNDMFAKEEATFDGSVDKELGVQKPKFVRQEILDYVNAEAKEGRKTNLSPSQIARILHPDEYAVYDAARLGRANGSFKPEKAALPQTDKSGNSGGGNPDNPATPKYGYENGGASIEEGLTAILNPQAS